MSKSGQSKINVLRWGPYAGQGQLFGGGIGGYARYNSQALRSFLAQDVNLIPLYMTVPKFRHPLLFRLHLVYRMLKDMLVVVWALFKYKPDVLHITALYWRSIYREWWAVRMAGLFGVRVFYDIRAGTFEEFIQEGTGLKAALTRDIMHRSARVAIQGRKSVSVLKQEYKIEASWLPNCFLSSDLARYAPAELNDPGEDKPLKLVFLGYLLPDKGVDVLLEVAYKLSHERSVQVTLIGAVPPQFEATLAAFQNKQTESFSLISTGRLELEDVLKHLREQHVFVFLSRFFGEGHPNAINEAMAMGLAIVASKQGFLDDVVSEDCGVKLDNPQDIEAAYTLIRDLAAHWPELKKKGQAARHRMETVFSSDVVLAKTKAIYEACYAHKQ